MEQQWEQWLQRWLQRLQAEAMDAEEVAQTMREASPKYVPRNWMLLEARGPTRVCHVHRHYHDYSIEYV